MINIGYVDFFGKNVSHIQAVKEKLIDKLIQIVTEENNISEKDFKRYDIASDLVKNYISDSLIETADNYIQTGKRLELLAEEVYNKDYKIFEKSKFAQLKDNKVPLSKEEREKVATGKAEWSDSRSAVWKSKNKKGKITYISNTHRAYNISPTLPEIIKKFHDFIKSTA